MTLGHIAHNSGTTAPALGTNQCAPTEAAAHQAVFAEIASAPGLEKARPSAGELARETFPNEIAGVFTFRFRPGEQQAGAGR